MLHGDRGQGRVCAVRAVPECEGQVCRERAARPDAGHGDVEGGEREGRLPDAGEGDGEVGDFRGCGGAC